MLYVCFINDNCRSWELVQIESNELDFEPQNTDKTIRFNAI